MANQTTLRIITPNGIFFEDKTDIVTVKTHEGGYIGLQHGRSPFVASLDIAMMTIGKQGSADFKEAAISGGLVVADKDKVEIITDDIIYKEDIDLATAEKDKNEAETALQQKHDETTHVKLEIELKNAINKINIKKG